MQETPDIIQRKIETLPGVGPAYGKRLQRIGVRTVGDLLTYLPRRYDDLREIKTLPELLESGSLPASASVTLRAPVQSASLRRLRGRRSMVTATLGDRTANLKAVWFNQPYLAESLQKGKEYVFVGKLRTGRYGTNLQSPAVERRSLTGDQTHSGRLVAVYPETEGLSSRWIRYMVRPLLRHADLLPETLPEEVRARAGLLPLADAVRSIHFPDDEEAAERARYRFDFEQVFYRQLIAQRRRRDWQAETRAVPIPTDAVALERFREALPWSLTSGQAAALDEILADMGRDRPMLRLLQGDVGSGKTAVAAAAARQADAAGLQTAFMAPTEVLARQHADTLRRWFDPLGSEVVLLVGGQAPDQQDEAKRRITAGVPIVVGTHALIQDDVRWRRLGLAVVDEQHRFGVEQRAKLRSDETPHLLSMTATPIPRTLALVAYGDQDISVIPERPAGRPTVTTKVVTPASRDRAFAAVRKELEAGRQAFVLYPVIADSKSGLKAAEEEFERLATTVFDGHKVALLHGRLPVEDKVRTMDAFAAGELDVLVSTSVVEVGVDVPNATVMLIEEAQQFGLAQLHQLRGRVGRGEHRSYCYLLPGDGARTDNERLRAMERTDSGFELAETDLELRGPGEVLGTAQSGFAVSPAGLSNPRLLQAARGAARDLLERDARLETLPVLRDKVLAAARLA
ncbi:MAG TPA: ATP-dependent DNA helicase RecG [Patescibacteria group bacterium]|jgi:ATP-dependent DNA helicase RecG